MVKDNSKIFGFTGEFYLRLTVRSDTRGSHHHGGNRTPSFLLIHRQNNMR